MNNRSIFDKSNGHKPGTSGNGDRESEFVACFNHAKVLDTEGLRFEEHVNRRGCKIFTMIDPTDNPVKIVGQDEGEEEEYEYCLALHNRQTKEVEMRPVSVLHFQPKPNITPEFLNGKVKRTKTNFTLDKPTNFGTDEYREKQQDLVMEFGNAKRRKILEASLRRRVGEDTLESLGSSMLETSNTNIPITSDAKGNVTLNLSMLTTPESMVLPMMNRSAKNPADMYSFDQFIKEDDLDVLFTEATTFLSEYNTVQKMSEQGVSPFVSRLIIQNLTKERKTYVLGMKLVTWTIIYKRIVEKRSYLKLNLNDINLPQAFVTDFVSDFTEGQTGKSPGIYKINSVFRNKLCAHLLCLLLLFSEDFTLPLAPIKTEIGVSEVDCKKLLESLGCLISTSTPEELALFKSAKVARLIGPHANQPFARRKMRGR